MNEGGQPSLIDSHWNQDWEIELHQLSVKRVQVINFIAGQFHFTSFVFLVVSLRVYWFDETFFKYALIIIFNILAYYYYISIRLNVFDINYLSLLCNLPAVKIINMFIKFGIQRIHHSSFTVCSLIWISYRYVP